MHFDAISKLMRRNEAILQRIIPIPILDCLRQGFLRVLERCLVRLRRRMRGDQDLQQLKLVARGWLFGPSMPSFLEQSSSGNHEYDTASRLIRNMVDCRRPAKVLGK